MNAGEQNSINELQEPTPKGVTSTRVSPSVSKLRSLLRDDFETWAQHNELNHWFCPHCGEIIPEITIPTGNSLQLLQDCPYVIKEHLTECAALKAGIAPDKYYLALQGTASKLKSGIHKAHVTQRKMLRAIPEIPGLEIGCLYRPMEALSGDFYDFITLPNGKMGFVIGDPSGHGIEACMLMAVTKKLINMYGRSGLTPADCLSATNCELYEDVQGGSFVSALYGIWDQDLNRFTYARAGQNQPLLLNPQRKPKLQVLQSGGIALGVDPGGNFLAQIEQTSVDLRTGDILLLYTDGIIEINDASGEELGVDGLAAIVEKYADREIEDILTQLWIRLENSFGSEGQQDDMTMLALRLK